jgi:hypothetical protein
MNTSEIVPGRSYKHIDQSIDRVVRRDGDAIITEETTGPGGTSPRPEWKEHRWAPDLGPKETETEKRVREAIEAIAINPSGVGLTHAKILRDEIVRLRSELAKSKQETSRLNGVERKGNELLAELAEANEELCDRVMDVVEDVIGLRVPLDENEEDPVVLRHRLCRTTQALSALDDLEPVITKLRQREIEALADD